MTTRGKATGNSERLAVLNSARQEALYGLPGFDDAQRLEFLAQDESELALGSSRQGFTLRFVGGKKALTGKNNIETDISNQYGRLISNAIISYNAAIRSRLLERLEAEDNTKGVETLTRISSVAWQPILLNGHYTFLSSSELIDLDTLEAGLKLA